jgi:hypothetical protein
MQATARLRGGADGISQSGSIAVAPTFNPENYILFRRYLESHRDELRVGDLELASFVCLTTIEALTYNAVLHHSKMLSGEAMETLIDEGARLMTGYLKGSFGIPTPSP